jgi:hypothetical protein
MSTAARDILLNATFDPQIPYVLFIHDEPEGLLLGDTIFAWPRGDVDPDMTRVIGQFQNDILVIDGRRAGKRTGLIIKMFAGKEYTLAERDQHDD